MSQQDTDHIDVRYVAKLARIELEEAAADRLQGELDKVLPSLQQLDELYLSGVAPLSHPHPLVNVLRDDVPHPSLDHEDMIGNAPSSVQRLVRVPQMIE